MSVCKWSGFIEDSKNKLLIKYNETILCTISSIRIQYLGINSTHNVKYLYNENWDIDKN